MAAWGLEINDSTPLTQQQWNHALAIVAQKNAYNDGYGQTTADFERANPSGYTLDELNAVYKGKHNWDATYNSLKQHEGKTPGNVGAIKKLAGGLASNVQADLKQYLESHPGDQPAAAPQETPDLAPDAAAQPAVESTDITGDSVSIRPLEEAVEEVKEEPSSSGHYVVDILLALLALGALAVAFLTRRSLLKLQANYYDDVEALNLKVNKLASELSRLGRHPRQEPDPAPQPRREQPAQVSAPARQDSTVTARPEPRPERRVQPRPKLTIYLSRPDDNECFMSATKDFVPGNSIYVLTTSDGRRGAFSVIENSDVHRMALMMPGENLVPACSGHGIQMSEGKTRIVTDREGEAVFENGRWCVSIKAIIHYE